VSPPRALIVDDEPGLADALGAVLRKAGFEVAVCLSGPDALAALDAADFDVVLTDLRMRAMDGLELCARVHANRPGLPVVVMTGFGSMDAAVGAIRAGAYDFVTKPVENETLVLALRRAVKHRELGEELRRLRGALESSRGAYGLVGDSPELARVRSMIERLRDSDATVLLTGESGTGKEVAAHAIHETSARAKGPFVAINCAAMPEALLESELFGHAKGAFTDARAARKGLFAQAEGGTIFLDEVGELPLTLQPKLLRALQERSVRPVGGDVEVRFDARVIAATNRDLLTAIDERRFREDLYYRLDVIHLALPPLRARGGDVLLLAQQFLERIAARANKTIRGISPDCAARLMAYAWPGNVRELQNAIERAVALARFEQLTVDDLPERVQRYTRSHVVVSSDDPTELVPLEEVERRYILRAMEALGGNKALVAQTLGIDRKTLYRKLERYSAP
jgi:two-component system response regulator HydG